MDIFALKLYFLLHTDKVAWNTERTQLWLFFYSASQIVSIKTILKSNMTSWLQSIALESACLNSNAGSAFDYICDQWLSFSICNLGHESAYLIGHCADQMSQFK